MMTVLRRITVALTTLATLALPMARADVVTDALAEYRAQGALSFDATAGARRWRQEVAASSGSGTLSCRTCHGEDLRKSGQHARTRKPILPMAPSVNPERLMDRAKIEKWFLRNCKGTWGRECTAQEKGDFLLYIQQQ